MEENKNKGTSKEPFSAEQTPAPPQVIEPNERKEEKQQGPEAKQRKKDAGSTPDSGRRLGESPTEIDDETTI